MVKSYEKGADIVLSKEFELADFDCRCEYAACTKTLVDEKLIDGLTELSMVFPLIVINSGFRCAAHNKDVGGEANSFHMSGKAADIKTPFADPKQIAQEAEAIKVFEQGGIGLYNSFVHVDTRGSKARWDRTKLFEKK